MKRLLHAAALLVALSSGAAEAKIVRLEIASKQPYGTFAAGAYERCDGSVVGELSPDEPGIPTSIRRRATPPARSNIPRG